MWWLGLVLGVAFACYYLAVIRRQGKVTADSLFVYAQTLMAAGSLLLIDPDVEAERIYGWILCYALLCYMIVSALLQFGRPAPRGPLVTVRYKPRFTTWLLFWFSVVVVVAYYLAVGHSALLAGLKNAFEGTEEDVATLRLESYSGSRYLFPGFVNQFKNALLPALLAVIITYWWQAGLMPRRRLITISLVLLAGFGLLGTGQRRAFVIMAVVVAVYVYLLRGRFPKPAVVSGLLVLLIMVGSTIALGRTQADLGSNPTIWAQSSTAASEFVDRIFLVNQRAGVIGFSYIYNNTSVQYGAEWLQDLLSISPVERPSDISNRIFASRYGSLRGTIPPSLWASIYYNFGISGIALAPCVLALVIVRITRSGMAVRERNPLELMGIAGVFTVLGLWVTGSPLFLLNSGIMVYATMWLVGSRVRVRGRREASEELPEPSAVR